jgi:hypothetical protein
MFGTAGFRRAVDRRVTAWFVAVGMALAAAGAAAADAGADDASLAAYTGKIRPLLAERCFSCHGGLKQEAGLRLDTVSLMVEGGESGGVIVKGDPDASLMLARVSDTDPASRMPPEGEGEPLTAEQLSAMKSWIAAGCPAPPGEKPEADPRDHWAFQPRVRPPVPVVARAGWVRNPIDAFIAKAHEKSGLAPQPEADRGLLVRRLHLDLIGLPPSPDELAAVEADPSPGWYEALVDRLLADPRHGERWGRHWMDVWRYSDWWGLGDEQRNSQRNIWHWRDWIVESLNADMPYDEMLRQMLAADELYPDDPGKLRATGYLARNFFIFNRTGWLDATVEHVGKGVLGLTMNCSKCHDHKYDPIQQADYYRMRAFFEPYMVRQDVVPGEADVLRDGIPRVFDGLLEAPTHLFVRGDDTKPDTTRPILPGVPDVIAFQELAIEPVTLPKTVYEPQRRPWVIDAHLATARRDVTEAEASLTKAIEGLAASTGLQSAGGAAAPADAKAAVDKTGRADFIKAEGALAVARLEQAAVARRADAMRAAWAVEEQPSQVAAEPLRKQAAVAARAAVRAEREVTLLKARLRVDTMERQYSTATADKRKAIDKALPEAREAVEKALKSLGEPGENFAPLPGAQWSATRFLTTTADDPPVSFPPTSTGRRRALARWVTDPRNPLTARVAVNHIWLRHMGRPLVSTVFDFGRKGNAPSHPELLDWLASELVEAPGGGDASAAGGPWSMKRLHRLIVTSAAYRMASSPVGAEGVVANNATIDPDNKLLWHRDSIRLEAQVIRDCMLSLAGTLDPTMGGPPVPPEEQAASSRRSLYFFHSDISQNVFLSMFDNASVKECYQRDQSIVPQQALALSNAALPHDAAARIVDGIAAGAQADAVFIERAFLTVLGRRPDAGEAADCARALADWSRLDAAAAPAAGAADQPARCHLVWALLNHNDFVTLR